MHLAEKISNQELLQAIAKGDEKALELLYKRYWKKLYCFAYKIMNNDQVCEDIVQEIFIQLWERGNSRVITNLESYLFQAIKYQVSNNLRKAHFSERHESLIDQLDSHKNIEEEIAALELNQHLKRIISELPQGCQKIFCMSRFDELSNKEIAEQLKISQRTVETQISKALKYLRTNLNTESVSLILLSIFRQS